MTSTPPAPTPPAISREQLLGTWRMVSCTRELVPSGEKTDLMGKNPEGYINYCADGRMLVFIVRSDRKTPAAATANAAEAEQLFRSMAAYGGTWKFEGGMMYHNVDIAWNETWANTKQERRVHYDGRYLTLGAGPNLDPVDGLLSTRSIVWEKVG